MMRELRLQLIGLQETELLASMWDDSPDTGGLRLVAPSERNGVAFLVHDSIHILDQVIHREFGLIAVSHADTSFVVANLHLPDNSTLNDRGLTLQGVLDSISLALEYLRVSHPWSFIFAMGDLNTVHVEGFFRLSRDGGQRNRSTF